MARRNGMRLRRFAVALVAAQALLGVAFAHEGHHHDAMGTVAAIDQEKLTLTTVEDKTEVFVITDDTTYSRGAEAVAREDVALGERAVVVYEKKDNGNVALEVKLSSGAHAG
jgi:hypothetical protein